MAELNEGGVLKSSRYSSVHLLPAQQKSQNSNFWVSNNNSRGPSANWLHGANPRHSAGANPNRYIYEKTSDESFDEAITKTRHSALPLSPRRELDEIPIDTAHFPTKQSRPETAIDMKKHNMPLEKLLRASKNGGSVF